MAYRAKHCLLNFGSALLLNTQTESDVEPRVAAAASICTERHPAVLESSCLVSVTAAATAAAAAAATLPSVCLVSDAAREIAGNSLHLFFYYGIVSSAPLWWYSAEKHYPHPPHFLFSALRLQQA